MLEETRQVDRVCDDYNPFEVYSPPRQLCPKRTSLSNWNHWRRHLIEVHLSVFYGNILESLRRVQQFSKVDVTEFEFVTMMMSETSRATNFYQFLRVHRARSRRVSKKHVTPKPYTRATFQRKLRRLFRRCVTFLWRQTQVWLSWTLERLKLLDPQRHTNLSFQQQVMSYEKVEMDVEAGRTMTFNLADGTTTCAHSLVWMQTPHGCFSTYIIDSNRSSDAAECQGTPGVTSNHRFCHERTVIPIG